jgi:predicted amidohydrolase YtcJ
MDGHSSSYSSRALARLGFAGIAKDGILSGEAHEFNMGRVTRLVMRGLDLRALSRGISSVVAEAVAGGLVSIHCLEGSQDLARDSAVALFKLIGPSLPLRLKLWLQYTELDRAEGHLPSLERKRVGGCFAWEMDGSVSSRSAAFDLPYLDGRGSGKLYRTGEEAFALVEPFYRAGWQTSAHAIGPRAIESILSAYERVMDGGADNLNSHRLRIDHFEFPRPDQIERAGRRRLLVAAQPGFAWADARLIHSYSEALAPELLARQSPLRSLLDSGCVVALSTDAPVLPLNPFIQIAGACAHPNAAERISVHEALRAYSWAGAYAAFEEEERGSLAVGKYADFALLDRDPFETPLSALHEIGVEGSWHEGRPLVAPPPDLAGFALAALRTKRRRT